MSDQELDAQVEELKRKAAQRLPKYPEMTLRQFLEESPPDTYVNVTDLKAFGQNGIETPDIVLFCEGDNCQGPRIFKGDSSLYDSSSWSQRFLTYTCRNCNSRVVRFAVSYHTMGWPRSSDPLPVFNKVGQIPAFGPHTPPRLISLIGPDRELFLQGRRAENRGLGIGAFAYYRRVVENQKNRIIAEIAKVAKTLGSSPEVDARFAAAIKETRFSDSVAMVKDFIPQALMITGQNPLTLLHTALSRGLHNPEMTDARCLQLAQSIRTVLAELAERSSEALKSTKEIQAAISVLMSVPNITDTAIDAPEPSDTSTGSPISRAE